MESSHRAGEPLRRVLDYVVWICREMTQVGFHGQAGAREWRRRVQDAYNALFVPVIAGHGDRYPPDVPEARNPGIWPDVPAHAIPGMTLRHQLKVVGLLAEELRDRDWIHPRAEEVLEWDRRFSTVRALLDHGTAHPAPEEAFTTPSKERMAAAEAEAKAIREHSLKRERRIQRIQKKAAGRKAGKAASTKQVAAKGRPAQKKATSAKKKAAAKKPAARKPAATKKAPAKTKAPAKRPAQKKAAARKAPTARRKSVKK
jgi:hypothetical protein